MDRDVAWTHSASDAQPLAVIDNGNDEGADGLGLAYTADDFRLDRFK